MKMCLPMTALEDEDEPEEAKALQEAAITQEEAGQEPDSQMKVSQQEEKTGSGRNVRGHSSGYRGRCICRCHI